MNRFLLCLAIAGMLVLPSLSHAAPPAKVVIAHIGDVEVVEEPVLDDDGNQIATAYTVTAYYNVIEISEKALKAHENHSIEVQGLTFADIIPYDGTKGDHFTVEEIVEVPVEEPVE